MGILPAVEVVRSLNAFRSRLFVLFVHIALLQRHTIHGVSPTPPSPTQRHRNASDRAKQERLLGRGPRQQQREQRILRDVGAATVRLIRGSSHPRARRAALSSTRTTRVTTRTGRRSRPARATMARVPHRARIRPGPRGGQPSGPQQQQGPHAQQTQQTQAQRTEDVGSQDAFFPGMIYALNRRLLPGAPYAPGLSGSTEAQQRSEGGRWKLDECLRCVPRSLRLASSLPGG